MNFRDLGASQNIFFVCPKHKYTHTNNAKETFCYAIPIKSNGPNKRVMGSKVSYVSQEAFVLIFIISPTTITSFMRFFLYFPHIKGKYWFRWVKNEKKKFCLFSRFRTFYDKKTWFEQKKYFRLSSAVAVYKNLYHAYSKVERSNFKQDLSTTSGGLKLLVLVPIS
jgi:hypothetical protein